MEVRERERQKGGGENELSIEPHTEEKLYLKNVFFRPNNNIRYPT